MCRHAIKVLTEGRETKLVKQIPDQYVLKRWTKNARLENVVQDMHGHEIEENPRLKQDSRYRFLCYKLTQIAARASKSDKAYELAVMKADELIKMVEDVLCLEINGDKHEKNQFENVLNDCSNDVNVVNAKGFKKKEATHQGKRRVKGRFENEISNSKRKPAQVRQF